MNEQTPEASPSSSRRIVPPFFGGPIFVLLILLLTTNGVVFLQSLPLVRLLAADWLVSRGHYEWGLRLYAAILRQKGAVELVPVSYDSKNGRPIFETATRPRQYRLRPRLDSSLLPLVQRVSAGYRHILEDTLQPADADQGKENHRGNRASLDRAVQIYQRYEQFFQDWLPAEVDPTPIRHLAAKAYASLAAEAPPEAWHADFYQAMGYALEGEEHRAIELLERVLAHVPNHREALARLARLYARVGRAEEADQFQEKLEALSPSHMMNIPLGGLVLFLGYDLDRRTIRREETFHVTLYWQALQRLSNVAETYNLHLFVDYWDRSWGGAYIRAVDRRNLPVADPLPSRNILRGAVFRSTYIVRIPSHPVAVWERGTKLPRQTVYLRSLPDGKYILWVGFRRVASDAIPNVMGAVGIRGLKLVSGEPPPT